MDRADELQVMPSVSVRQRSAYVNPPEVCKTVPGGSVPATTRMGLHQDYDY